MKTEEQVVIEQIEEKSEVDRNLDEAANVRYLQPEDFMLFRNEGGGLRITVKNDRSALRARARRCFPFALPTRFISIRDGNDEEIGIISDLCDLSKEYRRWIEEDLEMRYFAPCVNSIKSINQRYGGVEWQLETDRGARRVITKGVHDTMVEVEPGRYVLTDVDGNRYEVLTERLDEASKARLERLI